jgi:excisionase family DNA binding protein
MKILEEHRYLTVIEAAKLLRVSRDTAYRWLKAGLLPAKKVGGVWLVDAAALERQVGSDSAE